MHPLCLPFEPLISLLCSALLKERETGKTKVGRQRADKVGCESGGLERSCPFRNTAILLCSTIWKLFSKLSREVRLD